MWTNHKQLLNGIFYKVTGVLFIPAAELVEVWRKNLGRRVKQSRLNRFRGRGTYLAHLGGALHFLIFFEFWTITA
jgi:hypothetical protein